MSANNTTFYNNDAIEAGLSRAIVVAILCLISFFSVIGNSLVCLAIYQQPRLRTVMYLPLLSLAVADLLCGAVAMPAYIAKKFMDGRDAEGIVCDIFRFTYFFIEYASISSLVLVSVERMYTLKFPYKIVHSNFLHKIMVLLLVAWFDALLISLLPFIPWEYQPGPCSYNPTKWWSLLVIHKNVFIPFLIVIVCYGYIYKVALFHLKNIQREHGSSSDRRGRPRVFDWRRRRKATSTLFIVVGVFLLCWLPSSIYYYLQNICEHCFDQFIGEKKSTFNAGVKILTFFNSMTNPIIYGWRSREFRNAFRKMFCGNTSRAITPRSGSTIPFGCASSQVHESSRD